MKVSKIPGLGRFGVFIDDLDFNNLSDEEWLEIGNIHLNSLVTIIRNVDITPPEYERRINMWGSPHSTFILALGKKYRKANPLLDILTKDTINGIPVDPEDKKYVSSVGDILAYEEVQNPNTNVVKVTGKKKEDGTPLGMFAEGELLWHSNESGNLVFAPGVSLLGASGTIGSATGFVTTPDWYEEQSESFRSELDQMIIQHEFTPGRINPGLREEQDSIMHRNMCPVPTELPLVIQSPQGIKGIHYSVNTINSIKGMSQPESDKIFEYINKTLFVEKYIYDHWYQQDNDLCLFDNSVTLHRRLGGIANRMCYRIQYQYSKLIPNRNPYLQEPFISDYVRATEEFKEYTY
jgi:alpha-ketoglutarate-dependent taurine dioxygenase